MPLAADGPEIKVVAEGAPTGPPAPLDGPNGPAPPPPPATGAYPAIDLANSAPLYPTAATMSSAEVDATPGSRQGAVPAVSKGIRQWDNVQDGSFKGLIQQQPETAGIC